MSRIVYIGAPEADAQTFAELIRADCPGLDLFATNDRGAAFSQLHDTEVLIGHHFQFDEQLVESTPKLRWIQSLTTGTDAIIKIVSLPPRVVVTSTRGMHGPQMSELVFLQMLSLNRNFPRMLRNQQQRRWERWPQPLLLDKTMVIVGVGAIAECLALRAKAFGMKVMGVSGSARLPPGFDHVFGRDQLREAASMADFLVVVVPLSAQTENLIDLAVLERMKSTAYVINVARGAVLDEVALSNLIHAGRIAGAALDVFRKTPLDPDSPLWAEEDIILTSQLGGMSDIYLQQAYPYVRDNLRHFLEGRIDRMINVVER